jgi:hypothetical protein
VGKINSSPIAIVIIYLTRIFYITAMKTPSFIEQNFSLRKALKGKYDANKQE